MSFTDTICSIAVDTAKAIPGAVGYALTQTDFNEIASTITAVITSAYMLIVAIKAARDLFIKIKNKNTT